MISSFILDNGAYANEIWDNPKYHLSYTRLEERELQNFVSKKTKFKDYDLKNYFASLPTDRVAMAKAPLATFFINDLAKYTKREIKVIYVIRNPEQIILSSIEKSNKSFIFYFERIAWMYRFMVDCQFEVLPVIAERIKKDGKKILEYCELPSDNINYDSIKPLKSRKPNYLKYRFANILWKRLSIFFEVF